MLEISNENIGNVIKTYMFLKGRKEKIQTKHKDELSPTNSGMQEIENAMLLFLNVNNLASVKDDGGEGMAYKKTRTSATVQDANAFFEHCMANPDLRPLMEIRASAKTIDEHLADDGDMPPGVKFTRHQQVVFNRGK
jgi:hypothetical protein